MLWVIHFNGFYVEDLKAQTQYRTLLRLVGGDDLVLEELAEDLTEECQKNLVTRTSMILSLGQVAVRRRKGVAEVLTKRLGHRVDWKIVSMGVDYCKADPVTRFFGSLFTPLPVLWIRFAL